MKRDIYTVRDLFTMTLFDCNRLLRVLEVPDEDYPDTVDVDSTQLSGAIADLRSTLSSIERQLP